MVGLPGGDARHGATAAALSVCFPTARALAPREVPRFFQTLRSVARLRRKAWKLRAVERRYAPRPAVPLVLVEVTEGERVHVARGTEYVREDGDVPLEFLQALDVTITWFSA